MPSIHSLPNFESSDLLLKKIIYSASHRGTKENDLLLGTFAKDLQSGLTTEDLLIFAELLEENDDEIYAWLTAQQKFNPGENLTSDIPKKYRTIIQKIIAYDRFRTKG